MITSRMRTRQRSADRPSALTREELEEELQIALGVRFELGRELEKEIVESFLDRIERNIDTRIDARLKESSQSRRLFRSRSGSSFWLLFILLFFAIPLTAVGGFSAGVPGVAMAWVAIFLLYFMARDR